LIFNRINLFCSLQNSLYSLQCTCTNALSILQNTFCKPMKKFIFSSFSDISSITFIDSKRFSSSTPSAIFLLQPLSTQNAFHEMIIEFGKSHRTKSNTVLEKWYLLSFSLKTLRTNIDEMMHYPDAKFIGVFSNPTIFKRFNTRNFIGNKIWEQILCSWFFDNVKID